MTLIDDWRKVLRKAWSMKLAVLAAMFSAAEVVLPFAGDVVPPRAMAALALVTALGAALTRILYQPKLHE